MKNGILLVLLLFVACSVSKATPTQWKTEDGGNGHWYEVIEDATITCIEAKSSAELLMHLGVNGHLVTITSFEENEFIKNNLPVINTGYFIGAFQPVDYPEPPYTDGWEWVTGEAWGFAPWGENEPNNNPDEDGIEFYGSINGPSHLGTWNDIPITGFTRSGYIVEYPIPEPGSMALLMLGGAAMMRRKKK